MSEIDSMPIEWRALVHEYGLVMVRALRDNGLSAWDAADALENWRCRRQIEWLQTNFVRPRSMADAFDRAMRH